ncbi:MAG TPA: hypothetical protein PKE55_11240 [Kiritimatiellia bacterium]|nr:hypothetical protein [Kiritimatiellia bacterium]
MNRILPRLLVPVLAISALILALGSGCDETQQYSLEIPVDPPSITLTNTKIWAVTFRAGGRTDRPAADLVDYSLFTTNLAFPLEWSVSDSSLGRIIASADASAVFESAGRVAGITIVRVRDQAGREGQATVVITPPDPVEP